MEKGLSSQKIVLNQYLRESEYIQLFENSRDLSSSDSHMFHHFQNIIMGNMEIRIIESIMLTSSRILMVQVLVMKHQNSVMSTSSSRK